jgi:hypothetical protein
MDSSIPASAWKDCVGIGGKLSDEKQECLPFECSVGYNMKWANYTFLV